MPSRDDLTPAQVIDIVSGDDVAGRNDLLRQAIAEAAGGLHQMFTDDEISATFFDAEKFRNFQERLGYVFPEADFWLLRAALTHKSFMAEAGNFAAAERLAWLGDAKLYFVVGEALVTAFPTAAIGDLAPARSMRIKRTTLSDSAKNAGVHEILLLGKSYITSKGTEENARSGLSSSMLGEAFEAVLGAVSISGGLEAVRKVYFRSAPLPATISALRNGG
jgi:dsRNA-specific ribonuclease